MRIASPLPALRWRAAARLGVVLALGASFTVPPALGYSNGGEHESLGRADTANVAPVPENFHARLDEAFGAALSKAGAPIGRASLTESEVVAEARLAERVPGLAVSRDDVSLLPVSVISSDPTRPLAARSAKAGESPEAVARAFFSENRAFYGMSTADLASLRVRYVSDVERGATIVKFDQYVDGIQLFETEMAVAMTKAGEVVATAGRMYPRAGDGAGASRRFALPAEEAITRALGDLTGRAVAPRDFEVVTPDTPGGYAVYAFKPDRTAATRFLGETTRVKPVLFPLAAGRFVPGYYLELWVEGEPAGSGPVFSYVISAEDGTMLFRNNLTQRDSYSYRVYAESTGDQRPWDGPTGTIGTPHPTGSPNGFQAPFLLAPLVTIESLLGPTDPWLPPGATTTTGNHTDAFLDIGGIDGFNAGDIRGTGVAGVFEGQYNSTLAAEDATNRQAAVVGMFYQVNWMHDIWYRHGFNEASGNAQTSNYGRGGLEGDSLRAEGQDQSGTDNANMSTPADGSRPRMQMYKFRAGGRISPTRDGTFDMLIVGHELGHYISNRLIGNASGLTNRQGGSLGEGWGDFNCVLTTVLDSDNVEGTTYAVGGQTDIYFCNQSFVDNYYYSIRRYPMSSDKLKNPLTFKDIGPGITTYPGVAGNPCLSLTGSPSEVHNSGEIWSQMLWECFAGLARAYGVQVAREKMFQYFVDGMKMTPTQPTFTEARAGVVAAAMAANGYANPKDAQILWKAFAKRGIGTNAVSPPRTNGTHTGVVEDFTAEPALPNDTIGVYGAGTFFERDVHFGGGADQIFSFGAGGLAPLVGNWDGSVGVGPAGADTPGLYDTTSGTFFLKNSNGPGPADTFFSFGPGGVGAIGLAGDWDGNGTTTIGIYLPSTGSFFLKNTNAAGGADVVFNYGPSPSTLVPVVGDWDGNGTDTVGLYDPATGAFFIKNTNAPGGADAVFSFGAGGDFLPLGGDWNSDGVDTIGLFSPSLGLFYLRNSNSGGAADETLSFGFSGALPVAGNFDGM